MILTQNIRLNVNQLANYTYVTAKQADANSRFLKITFCDDMQDLTVPAGALVTLRALKPDGTSCAISGTRNNDGTVTVELTNQVLAIEGLVRADVSTSQNGEVLSTATFFIKVGAVPIGTAIVSSNEFLDLTDLYTQISTLFPVDTANLVDDAVTPAKVDSYVFAFRGEISDLAYTSANQCKEAGWYRFATADLATFGDLPDGVTTGGIVRVYAHTSTARWQCVTTTTGDYYRYNADNIPGNWRSVNAGGGIIKTRIIWSATGDGNDSSTERIMIYQYASSELSNTDRVTISFYHSVYANNDADVWRMGYVYKYINGTSTRLTRQSEWECAMSADGHGYIGGYIHGHEKNATIYVYVDGEVKTQSQLSSLTEFTSLRIISTSDIYDVDGTTKICEHGKEWKYENGVLTISQSLKFVGSFTINNCYLTMLPPLKSVVYGYYHNGEFKKTDFPSTADYTIDLPGMTEVVVLGVDAWMNAGITYYPKVTARTPFVTDHNDTYNKFYIPACSDTAVSNGDLWTSQSYYKFK